MFNELEIEVTSNGTKYCYLDGMLHNPNGPAIEFPNGSKEWYSFGNRHRENGPAIDLVEGLQYFYLEDDMLDPKEAIKDPILKETFPKLIESMIIYLVHSS
jgi:hypothetical protein